MNNNEFNNNQQNTVNPNVPVQPAVPSAPVEVANNNMEPKKNNNGLIIIVSIIAIGVIAAVLYFVLIKNDDKSDKEPNKETNTPIEDPVEKADLSVWNGVYVNDGVSITIYQSGDDMVSVDISTSTTDGNTVSGSSIGFDVDVTSETTIVYDDDFLEDGANIVIEKTDNGIMVTSSSDETDSLLNNINGSYAEEEFTEYGWSGTYKNGDVSLILSEVSENYVVCTITKGYSVVSLSFDEVTESTLTYEDVWDGDIVNITLTEVGIKITATAEDNDSLLNEVNGNYTKELRA